MDTKRALAVAACLAASATMAAAQPRPMEDREPLYEELASTGELTYGTILGAAEEVFFGTVSEMHSYHDPDLARIYTDVCISITETLKGQPRDNTVVKVPGGRIGTRRTYVSGQAEFELGEQVLVYCRAFGAGTMYTPGDRILVGGWFGKQRIARPARAASEGAEALLGHLRALVAGTGVDDVRFGSLPVSAGDAPGAGDGQTRAKALSDPPTISSVSGFAAGKVKLDFIDTQSQGETLADTLFIYGDHLGSQTNPACVEYDRYNTATKSWATAYEYWFSDRITYWSNTCIKLFLKDDAQSGQLRVVNDQGLASDWEPYEVFFNTLGHAFWTDAAAQDIDYWFAYRINADSTVSDVMWPYETYADAKDAVDAAFDTWQDVEYSDIVFDDQGYTDTLTPHDAGDHEQIVSWRAFGTNAGGCAWVQADNDTIFDVDIELNYRLPSSNLYWTASGPNPYFKDIQEVVTHEIGHLLGMADQYGDADSLKTMYYSSNMDVKRRTLTASEEAFAQWVHYSATPRQAAPSAAPTPSAGGLVLRCNEPNPFNPQTIVRFEIAQPARTSVRVLNSVGQVIRTLMEGRDLTPGEHALVWDGADQDGLPASSGVYIWQVVAGDLTRCARMTLLR